MAALRAAIIGAGFMGRVHARAIERAGAAVAVVASSTIDRAVQAMPSLRAQRAASAAEAATSDDVDVVHICTPNSTHLELVELAFGAGKHVVCEKPLATDLQSATRMAAAVPAGRVAAVPFVYRFYGSVREAQGRVRAGDLGPLHLLHGHYLQDWLSRPTDTNWRVDPGSGGLSRAFADIGVHWCDLIEFVSGHRISRLAATTKSMSGRPTEDAAVVLFETNHGAAGSAVISQVSPGRKNQLWFEIDGADASVAFDQEVPEVLWLGGRDQTRIVMRGSEASAHSDRFNSVPVGHPQGYQDCFDAFVSDVYAAIRGELPDGLPVFADGLRAASLTDAMLASAANRTWVEVPHAAV